MILWRADCEGMLSNRKGHVADTIFWTMHHGQVPTEDHMLSAWVTQQAYKLLGRWDDLERMKYNQTDDGMWYFIGDQATKQKQKARGLPVTSH